MRIYCWIRTSYATILRGYWPYEKWNNGSINTYTKILGKQEDALTLLPLGRIGLGSFKLPFNIMSFVTFFANKH